MHQSLFSTVGNGRTNNEDDVRNVRAGLNSLNYRTDDDKADGIFTRPLENAIF